MGCSCMCAVPRLSSHTNVGVGGGKNRKGTLHCPRDHGKHPREQCDTCRPDKGSYSFPSGFETDAIFTSERLLFAFVGREQDPLCHCTVHMAPPKREPGAPQLLPEQNLFKAHSTPGYPALGFPQSLPRGVQQKCWVFFDPGICSGVRDLIPPNSVILPSRMGQLHSLVPQASPAS